MTHPFATAAYAAVFADKAEPLWVAAWRTHVMVRPIPGSSAHDAVGPYPLTALAADADLKAGLAWLAAQGLVSVGLTPDPLTQPPLTALKAAFPLCVAFKPHFVVDPAAEVRFSKHHRYEVKRARAQVEVGLVELGEALDAWTALYAGLVERHGITGLAQLDRAAFGRLARVGGLHSLAARADGRIVSMHLWLEDDASRTVQSLLAASSEEGYARAAPYAVYDEAIRLFLPAARLNLGGAAGLAHAADNGLARFKRGFANAIAQAHFCGAVLDETAYVQLCGGPPAPGASFPAYRAAAARPD